jgi:hypothetical protein
VRLRMVGTAALRAAARRLKHIGLPLIRRKLSTSSAPLSAQAICARRAQKLSIRLSSQISRPSSVRGPAM